MDINTALQAQGLVPKTWTQVLDGLKAKLPPQDMERFTRLHKNFTGYLSEDTLTRFYDFVFTHSLQIDINCFRHRRLSAILSDLILEVEPDSSILDIGAGAGIIAKVLGDHFRPKRYVAQDISGQAREHLSRSGLQILPHPAPPPVTTEPFDLILCVDSLGEINSDEDGALADPSKVDDADLPNLLEQRYGFAQKLAPWRNYLSPSGRLLLWEPITHEKVWSGLATSLRDWNWQVKILTRESGRCYLELRPD